jgi:OPT family small oligopeptide transporter
MNRHHQGRDEDYPAPLSRADTSYSSQFEKEPATRVNSDVRQAEHDIQNFARAHAWDPNFPDERLKNLENILEDGDPKQELQVDHELQEVSPYPEVNAAVATTDDITLPINTFRAWFLGMVFVMFGSGLNVFLSLRDPAISITPLVVQLIVYPFGLLMAKTLPTRQFTTFGHKWSLNPGPFNIKEHALITIMANVAFSGGSAAYSTDTLQAQMKWYNVDWGVSFALLYTLSTQAMGLGLAGLCRRFLVTPSSAIYPGILPTCALFKTLHEKDSRPEPGTANGWKMDRYRFFLIILVGGTMWYWVPGFLFTALSQFSWIVWLKPKDVTVNRLFGAVSGLGLVGIGSIPFDWSTVVGYMNSPLVYPGHAVANIAIGFVAFIWIASPAIGMSGVWYSDYLPISTNKV